MPGSLVGQTTMEWLDAFRTHLLALPNLVKFAILMVVIVGVPPLARRIRIPELVGLLVFGVLLGPHVLGVYGVDHPVVQFFADLGKLMLLFTAGLEVDINRFRQARTRSVAFGVITAVVPQVFGTA
jgi:Kef-type K+ transport system membrane component KefB